MTPQNLKIALAQMNVVPGRPDLNTDYVIKEIAEAASRGVNIIIFPELCIPGYLIADKFEDSCFIADIQRFNQKITDSTPDNIVAVFGSVVSSAEKGEDGRSRLHNAAIVTQGGKQLGYSIKTLQPHYRYFDDDKHLFSTRKVAEESAELYRTTDGKKGTQNCSVNDLLGVYQLQTPNGKIPVGVGICEDFWKDDYALNPAKVLVEKGAKLLIAISASPWGWQKNRKRHQVIKNLIGELKVPIIYVNNTGCQNNGDNVVVFDGTSTIYNATGDIVHEMPAYWTGTKDITLNKQLGPQLPTTPNDAKELYEGVRYAVESMLLNLPENKRQVVIGLSGGIDSATVAALMVDILGPERVHLINMPYEYSDPTVQNLAKTIVGNLGASLSIKPIAKIVEAVAEQIDTPKGTLTSQNIQARSRMEILAAQTQKLGGVFTCNSNKVEMAFGYGTMYGDIAGWLAPLGDLVKREVRQLAQYLNTEVFKKEVIPQTCIDQIPSAELEANQKDPFDYGYPIRRGYHDEWVRAVTEFRWNPEKFLELYLNNSLESELLLAPGTLAKLFPTLEAFINDLEQCWESFHRAFFKRVQAPPIIIVSRRAFGRDLEESLLTPHYTQRYNELKQQVLPHE